MKSIFLVAMQEAKLQTKVMLISIVKMEISKIIMIYMIWKMN